MIYTKLIIVATITLIVFLGYQYVVGLQEDNATLTGNVAKLELTNDQLSEEKKHFKEDLLRQQTLIITLNTEISKIEKEKNEVIRLFGDHDFALLVKKKPGLIQKRIDKATKSIFKDIENETKK